MEQFDIGIITLDPESENIHRCTQFIRNITNKDTPYRVFIQSDKEIEAVNFNRMLKRFESDYVVYLNDDTEILDPDWLLYMYGLCRLDNVGIVGCAVVTNAFDRMAYLCNPRIFNQVKESGKDFEIMNWVSSYCWMWNRKRFDLHFDENIPTDPPPWGNGAVDIDGCGQAWLNNFLVLRDWRFRVCHIHRTLSETAEMEARRIARWDKQAYYLYKKWNGQEWFRVQREVKPDFRETLLKGDTV